VRLVACYRAIQHFDRYPREQHSFVDKRDAIADISNLAYAHLAPGAGVPLELYPGVSVGLPMSKITRVCERA
jgi:hypothetical protein